MKQWHMKKKKLRKKEIKLIRGYKNNYVKNVACEKKNIIINLIF